MLWFRKGLNRMCVSRMTPKKITDCVEIWNRSDSINNTDKYCWKKPIKNIKNFFERLLFRQNIFKLRFIYRRMALESNNNPQCTRKTLNIFKYFRNNNEKLLGYCLEAKEINPSSLLFFQKDGTRFFFVFKGNCCSPGEVGGK